MSMWAGEENEGFGVIQRVQLTVTPGHRIYGKSMVGIRNIYAFIQRRTDVNICTLNTTSLHIYLIGGCIIYTLNTAIPTVEAIPVIEFLNQKIQTVEPSTVFFNC